MEDNKNYKGVVVDALHEMDNRTTKYYSTFKEAHEAAEKLCKKTMGDRGSIRVLDRQGNIQ